MKKALFFILAGAGILLAYVSIVMGSALGTYLYQNQTATFGATTARTTITNPWTFSATTTMNGNLVVTTSNSATSTLQIGCIQMYATSTATAIRLELSTTTALATYTGGPAPTGVVAWRYGYCPKLP